MTKNDILNYIYNSPLDCENTPAELENMPGDKLLELVGGVIDTKPNDGKHSYEIISIDSFQTAKQYEHYAPTWCIFQSEEVFYEESHQGTCHFIFFKRDDAEDYGKLAFGEGYPYDNYGMSFFEVLLTQGNRVVSVTSRRNWDEDYDHYLNNQQLKEALGEVLYKVTINEKPIRLLQISDTHNRHNELTNLPEADIIIHCGDFTEQGTEKETLDFLNWFLELPHMHKIFVTGNHDLCLWDAEGIEDLPENIHFLQDRGCEIEGIKFFGLAYNHSEELIPDGIDVLVTHEPPVMILDESSGTHWGNAPLRNHVFQVKPKYHLFGHAHDAFGILTHEGICFSNGSCLDDQYVICRKGNLFVYTKQDD